MSLFEILSHSDWTVTSYTHDATQPADTGTIAIVESAILGRRITTRLTQLDLLTEQFWDEDLGEMRSCLIPVVMIGMRVEPVIYKSPDADETHLISYLIGFRPCIE